MDAPVWSTGERCAVRGQVLQQAGHIGLPRMMRRQ